MPAAFLPAKQAWLMLPLVGRASQDQCVLFPDTAAGKVETCIHKCPAEVQSLRICVEYVDGTVIGEIVMHAGIGRKQELVEVLLGHVVIQDLPCRFLHIYVIRWVRHDDVCLHTIHQLLVGSRIRGVATENGVSSQEP